MEAQKAEPFQAGEEIFWRDLSFPWDTPVVFEAYDGGEFALVRLLGDVRRVPVAELRHAMPVW
jgi:hypothetical protein